MPELAGIAVPTFVSLNPCTDAILVEVAEPEQILALSHYSHDPSASSIPQEVARKFAVTGGTAEEVFALDPDIVLASTFMQPASRSALEDLGLLVEAFGIASDPASSIAQIEQIAELAGKPQRGEALALKITRALAKAEPPIGAKPIDALMWQPGQIVPGEETLVGDLMRRTGFASHSASQGLGQADFVSLERLLANPPELVLVAGRAKGQRHPLLDKLINTRIEQIDSNMLYCGGQTIIRAAERLSAIREKTLGERTE